MLFYSIAYIYIRTHHNKTKSKSHALCNTVVMRMQVMQDNFILFYNTFIQEMP